MTETICAVRTEDEADDEHLADVPAGAGCTEIWEYLSARRESSD